MVCCLVYITIHLRWFDTDNVKFIHSFRRGELYLYTTPVDEGVGFGRCAGVSGAVLGCPREREWTGSQVKLEIVYVRVSELGHLDVRSLSTGTEGGLHFTSAWTLCLSSYAR